MFNYVILQLQDANFSFLFLYFILHSFFLSHRHFKLFFCSSNTRKQASSKCWIKKKVRLRVNKVIMMMNQEKLFIHSQCKFWIICEHKKTTFNLKKCKFFLCLKNLNCWRAKKEQKNTENFYPFFLKMWEWTSGWKI